jgi:hypothetical protein
MTHKNLKYSTEYQMKTEELLVAPLLEERPTHPGRVA